jgi:uncharacterized protein YpbB
MFLTNFGNKANVVEGVTTAATLFYDQRNQSVHIPDGLTMMSLSASQQLKTRAATDHVCQIMLNGKLMCIVHAKLC